jgi:hypothetical protein
MRRNVFSLRRYLAFPLSVSGLILMSPSLFAQHTYYISKSAGSDTNTAAQAQSKSTPWAHLPGMPSCTSNCASYTPVAGDSFILKGGDTWVASDLDVWWQWAGSSSAGIYIGVDQTWYSGSSWTRPIWTCGGAACSYTLNGNGFYTDYAGVQYVTVDNIEMTGLAWTSSYTPNYFSIYGSHNTFEHMYIHGWSHCSYASGCTEGPAAFASSTCCGGGLFNVFQNNVIDGTDTDQQSLSAFFGSGLHDIHGNMMKYVSNGLEGSADTIHDNWCGPVNVSFATGAHQNCFQQQAPVDSTNTTIYNNVATGVVNGGIIKFWTMQSAVNNGSLNTYVFNNVMFANDPGNDVDICQLGTNCGTHYFFNNTFECGQDSSTDSCSSPGGGGPTTVVYWANNHCITSGTCFNNLGTNVTATLTTNLTQSVSAASLQGYASTSTDAFQPTTGGGSTVGGGTNYQSYCNNINGFDTVAGAACQNTTGYGCSYITSNHTVSCPSLAVSPRSATGAWSIGAYQSAPSGCTVSPGSIGPYTAGQSVSQQFTASGCTSSTFTISSGSMSGSGLTLSSGGLLSGAAQAGSFSFTVAYGTAADTISVTINAALVPPTSLTAAVH